MRVFISSTVYDLLDVRAELAELMRGLGISPVLSDDKLSDFAVQFDVNSIETCLINVDSCDQVIVILDKRYGPTLGNVGYDDISATHLEYRRATEKKKPVYFFVRDRLEADYSIWRRNGKKSEMVFSWIDKKDVALFSFIEEHRKLETDATKMNWYSTFSNSTDLKTGLKRYFEQIVSPERLVNAIYENRFPLFSVDVDVDSIMIDHVDALKVKATLTNISTSTAFNFSVFWEGDAHASNKAIMPPTQKLLVSFIYGLHPNKPSATRNLNVSYETPIGISVTDRYEVRARVRGGPQPIVISGATLFKRTFAHSKNPILEISNA